MRCKRDKCETIYKQDFDEWQKNIVAAINKVLCTVTTWLNYVSICSQIKFNLCSGIGYANRAINIEISLVSSY